jgi:hypothetical protein
MRLLPFSLRNSPSLRFDQTAPRPQGGELQEVRVAQPQPEYSENDSTVGGIVPIPSLAGALPAGSPPGAVWLTMCAWCARMKVRDRWVDVPHDLELIDAWGSREPRVTHGICPSCFDETTAMSERNRPAPDEA